jgi:hypothetical protein
MAKNRRGISHVKCGRVRVKLTTAVNAGATKPFLIKAKAGGQTGGEDILVSGKAKKIAVYRAAGFKRKVTTMRGPTVPHMVEKIGIDGKWIEHYVLKNFSKQYRIQLKKAKYVGKYGN